MSETKVMWQCPVCKRRLTQGDLNQKTKKPEVCQKCGTTSGFIKMELLVEG